MRYLLLLTSLALTPLNLQAKNLYRYIDDNGQTVLKDSLPPHIAPKGYSILNEKGRVIEVVKPAKTPEELAIQAAAEREQKRIDAENQRLQNEENNLRSTFTSIDDIVRARDNQLAALDVQLSIIMSNLGRLNEDLKNWQKQAAGFEREGRPIPQALTVSTNSTLSQIENNEVDAQAKRDEQQQIRNKFTQILRQFQVMVARQSIGQWQAKASIDNLQVVQCQDAARCEGFFRKTAEMLQEQKFLNTTELSDGQVFLSHLPSNDEQIGYWLVQTQDRKAQLHLALKLFCRETPAGHARCQSDEAQAIARQFRQLTGTQ